MEKENPVATTRACTSLDKTQIVAPQAPGLKCARLVVRQGDAFKDFLQTLTVARTHARAVRSVTKMIGAAHQSPLVWSFLQPQPSILPIGHAAV